MLRVMVRFRFRVSAALHWLFLEENMTWYQASIYPLNSETGSVLHQLHCDAARIREHFETRCHRPTLGVCNPRIQPTFMIQVHP